MADSNNKDIMQQLEQMGYQNSSILCAIDHVKAGFDDRDRITSKPIN